MSQEWNPNAPQIGQDFDNAKDNAPHEPEQQSEQIQGIATQAELEMRKAQMKKLAPLQNLTIGGTVEQAAHQKEFEENQARREYLDRRLNQRSLKRDFDRSR